VFRLGGRWYWISIPGWTALHTRCHTWLPHSSDLPHCLSLRFRLPDCPTQITHPLHTPTLLQTHTTLPTHVGLHVYFVPVVGSLLIPLRWVIFQLIISTLLLIIIIYSFDMIIIWYTFDDIVNTDLLLPLLHLDRCYLDYEFLAFSWIYTAHAFYILVGFPTVQVSICEFPRSVPQFIALQVDVVTFWFVPRSGTQLPTVPLRYRLPLPRIYSAVTTTHTTTPSTDWSTHYTVVLDSYRSAFHTAIHWMVGSVAFTDSGLLIVGLIVVIALLGCLCCCSQDIVVCIVNVVALMTDGEQIVFVCCIVVHSFVRGPHCCICVYC